MTLQLKAQNIEDIKYLVSEGDLDRAVFLCDSVLQKHPRSLEFRKELARLYYTQGDYTNSLNVIFKASRREQRFLHLLLAKNYIAQYNFEKAEAILKKIRKYKKSQVDIDEILEKLDRANSLLPYCQEVEVLDSIQINREDLYRFPGQLLSKEWGRFYLEVERDSIQKIVYETSLSQERFLVKKNGQDLDSVYFIQSRIGKDWGEEKELTIFSSKGNKICPVLRQDGLTLIFAKKGREGIGGFDLYLSRRDIDTREFLDPVLLGMPFNSPFDDYYLIYDDWQGIALLASNRFCPPDKVNLYMLKINKDIKRVEKDDWEALLRKAKLIQVEKKDK